MEYNNQECATCPYGKEEYERRRRFSEECKILFNKIDESDTDTFYDIFCDCSYYENYIRHTCVC